MATKFTVQVTDYLADAVTTGDLTITEDMVDLWMQEGAKYAINRMPKRLWHHFSSESAEKTAAYASERPLRVMREAGVHDDFLDCRQITPSSAKDFATIAPVSDPVWYHENGSVDVLPTAVATIGAFKVIEVTLPTIDASVDSTISNFPADLYQACVKYAVIQAKLREFAFMRRQSQDEIEAAIALLVSAATAVAASKTQFDLVAAIIVEGSVEFDKITALLGLGEADSETSVNTALAAIVTALGKVAPIIVEASAEYDLVNPDIDAAQDILDDDESVPRTTVQLGIAGNRVNNGSAFLQEAMGYLKEATGYAQEVNNRLSQAATKRQEGGSRAQSGSAYLTEAQSTIAAGAAFLSEISGYIAQAQVRSSNGTMWLNMGTQTVADKGLLQADIDNDIASFIQ